ncbi:PfkB family carbohydrate kinase [Marinoscillum furvescens]|uniref:Fructokinase n=1 Tax=Marinoscillum furvescens DSM 4134 TaxID=1122208 RepID=A0A3D9LGE9_MARFU|nr:PfkB family carbohydrate kinase [Marinoscillum furvescens]REE05534.1 fructokinase [Marinoscillum furvescens DSM 4134]
MSAMKVLAFGEVLWDFIEGEKHFGGAPLNFAAHVVQCGGESAIVSAVGKDKLGEEALMRMKALNVSTKWVQQNNHTTGQVMVVLENGQPSYRIREDVAYDYIDAEMLDISDFRNFKAFYFGTLAQRNEQSRIALNQIIGQSTFETVFFDVNLRKGGFTKAILEQSFVLCTIAKMNDDEVVVMSKLLYDKVMDIGGFITQLQTDYPNIKTYIITRGGEGCTIVEGAVRREVESKAAKVKDTVGAGDAFCAAFLTSYLKTGDALKSARMGNLVGGFVVSESGAVPLYPPGLKRKVELLSEG